MRYSVMKILAIHQIVYFNVYTVTMNFTYKMIDLVICTMENMANWISSD